MARILVAEDDDNVRSFVVRALEMKGHEVLEAEDGGLAQEVLNQQNGQFDLLLSDIKMPVMDGIGLSLFAGAQFPNITILLMTGFADQRERASGLDSLIYDVIAKPFNLASLLEKVEDALNKKPIEITPLAKSGLNQI
ncbi:MAG: response regulator [Devosiaceae bacterium]|nr:response regulator [Devosiaceae bacterium]